MTSSTKTPGIDMGVSIGRAIVESDGERSRAEAGPCGDAVIQITSAIGSKESTGDPDRIVFVVDDDGSIRDAVTSLLKSVGLWVVTFRSAEEFLAATKPEVPSALLLDAHLPGMSGLELQEELQEMGTSIPIVFASAHGDIPVISRAMKAGAVEFLPKPLQKQELLAAIHEALDRDRASRREKSGIAKLRARFERLTRRQREVMALIVAGVKIKRAAEELGLAEITVRIHRQNVMQKMKAASLADLVRMAGRLRQQPLIQIRARLRPIRNS